MNMAKILSKKRESLGDLQASLRKAVRSVASCEMKSSTAQRNLDRARDNYARIRKELDDTFVSVKNANRV